jgi:hypothetical protein
MGQPASNKGLSLMLSTFFKAKPVLEEATRDWIFDTFAWCTEQLDGEFFQDESKLILPTNDFYPGSVSSVEEMAEAVFTNTIKFCGMTSWPIKLVPSEQFIQKQMTQLIFESNLRGHDCNISNREITPEIEIAFHSSQLNQPQDLVAYLVQILSSILVSQRGIIAPGGKEVISQTIDLVACFMGFGVVFANTAYQFKGGCGSCNNRSLNRQAALPELETVYALALFCVIKGCEVKQVKRQLKSHLYKTFKKAHKEISAFLLQPENAHYALLSANL